MVEVEVRAREKVATVFAKNEADGSFSVKIEESLRAGDYQAFARIVNEHGLQSDYSNQVTINISRSALFENFSANKDWIFAIALLSLFIIILLLIVYGNRRQYLILKKRLQEESRALEALKTKVNSLTKTKKTKKIVKKD